MEKIKIIKDYGDKKINEIIEWINKQDKQTEKYKGLIEKMAKMRETEHKATMETVKLTKDMMKKMTKDI